MSKIVFESNSESALVRVTRKQLKMILREAKDNPVRVLSHEPSEVMEVYVGEFYHELTRHHVSPTGRVLFSEEDAEDSGDWKP